MKAVLLLITVLVFAPAAALTAKPAKKEGGHGLKDAVVLIIRHAERPESGDSLAPAGEARAEAYVSYFKNFAVDGKAMVPDRLFAAADSKASHRPRLTLEPLAKALGLKIDARFDDDQPDALVRALKAEKHGRCVLISWRHGSVPDLLKVLGADPASVLPKGRWPDRVYDWVIQLRFDSEGRLIPSESKRIQAGLIPGDSR